ncbi:MAG: tetratricopeptide repeat protein, partial [Deltaproteobacteria bacterium]|nr:tetratricopeptide repeat protein [Deltaproteobacteria bacterium]
LVALIALIIGWLLGAFFSTRGVRLEKGGPGLDSTFLKGISSALSNDTDLAIAELTRAVELDSEVVETYIALGHLFRSKGQFDRAVAIRQSIIARSSLPSEIRIQALYDLGLDFRQGGLMSRAEEALRQVIDESPRHLEALKTLEQIYEELQEWEKALEVQRRVNKLTGQKTAGVLAHLKCEWAKKFLAAGEVSEARAAFKKALSWDEGCVDALLCLGDLYLAQGEVKKALATWGKVCRAAPQFCFLALERVTGRQWKAGETDLVEEFILVGARESQTPQAYLTAAHYLAAQDKKEEMAAQLRRLLEETPDFLPGHQALGRILLDGGKIDEVLSAYQNLLGHLPRGERVFQCRQCGFSSAEMSWKCPSCRQWDTIAPSD